MSIVKPSLLVIALDGGGACLGGETVGSFSGAECEGGPLRPGGGTLSRLTLTHRKDWGKPIPITRQIKVPMATRHQNEYPVCTYHTTSIPPRKLAEAIKQARAALNSGGFRPTRVNPTPTTSVTTAPTTVHAISIVDKPKPPPVFAIMRYTDGADRRKDGHRIISPTLCEVRTPR